MYFDTCVFNSCRDFSVIIGKLLHGLRHCEVPAVHLGIVRSYDTHHSMGKRKRKEIGSHEVLVQYLNVQYFHDVSVGGVSPIFG